MAMLRAFSRRRSRRGYERLLEHDEVHDEHVSSSNIGQFEAAQLKRARSVPARVFGLSRKTFTQEILALPADHQKSLAKSSSSSNNKKVTKSKITHPLFSLFDARRKKKTIAKPEFARYLEYLKEGGMWDMNANMPVIHYK
ncbi:hypothetical protein REPUB_Repub10bG0167200 [Reevesia pubescens]